MGNTPDLPLGGSAIPLKVALLARAMSLYGYLVADLRTLTTWLKLLMALSVLDPQKIELFAEGQPQPRSTVTISEEPKVNRCWALLSCNAFPGCRGGLP